MDDNVLNFG